MRLTKEYDNLAPLISKRQLGQDEMAFEDYMIMEGEFILEVEYCMSS